MTATTTAPAPLDSRAAHALEAGVVSAHLIRSLLATDAPNAVVACVGLGRVFVTLDAGALALGVDSRRAARIIGDAYRAAGRDVRLTAHWAGDLIVERASGAAR